MRFRLSALVLAVLLLSSPLARPGGETIPAAIASKVRSHYGPLSTVRRIVVMHDSILDRYLGKRQVLAVDLFRPRKAGREITYHMGIREDDRLSFLDTEPQVRAFVGRLGLRVVGEVAALELADLYCRLRRIDLVRTSADVEVAVRRVNRHGEQACAGEKGVRAPVVESKGSGYRVTLFAVVDPFIGSLQQIAIEVSTTGGLSVSARWVCSRGGYD